MCCPFGVANRRSRNVKSVMLLLSNGGFKTTTRHALLVQVALFWRSAFCGFCVDMVLVTRGEGPLFNKSSPEQLSLHSNLLHDQ